MNLMQMPLRNKAEHVIRDALVDKLQTKTIDQIVNETIGELYKLEEGDYWDKRYHKIITTIHSEDELKDEIRIFITRMIVHTDLKVADDIYYSGEFTFAIAVLLALLGAAAGALFGYLASEFGESRVEELEKETGWNCQVERSGEYCFIQCYDKDGKPVHTEETDCPGSN